MAKTSRGQPLKVLALEPYYGGSHRAFLAGLRKHSSHDVRVIGLPARKWKWRMRHSAVTLARRLRRLAPPRVILTSEFLNVAEFAGMLPSAWQTVPRVIYFHENQLTYPVPDEAERDYHYAFTHLTSILASRAAYFNSRFHLDEFFAAMEALLRKMPDFAPLADLRAARRRSKVLHLGCDLASVALRRNRREGPMRILWTHRWEADKDPGALLRAMIRLDDAGHDFRLILLGEHFDKARETLAPQLRRLAPRIEHAGYLPSRAAYRKTLARSDVVISTARHEFFGAGVVEAIAAGAWPILPDRLAYPEILPARLHRSCLYRTEGQLLSKLRWVIRNLETVRATNVSRAVERFDWPHMISRYDQALTRAASGK